MPENDRKLRVFLCHASQDKPIVRELYERLLAEGWIDPWLDEEKLLPGQDWDREIKWAVKSADAVIVCLSSGSTVKEGYIQKEIRFVLDIADEKPEGTIYVVPLRLEECSLPSRLMSWHYIDFFPKDRQSDTFQRLLDSLTLKATSIGVQKGALDGSAKDFRLRELLDSDIAALSATLEMDGILSKIAETTKKILRARYVYLAVLDQSGIKMRSVNAGVAPELTRYLSDVLDGNILLDASMSLLRATRVRDIRKLDVNIQLDDNDLQSFISVPIRLNRSSIGSILVFGKNDVDVSFSEEDETLATVISVQAGMAIESFWLYQELKGNLSMSSMLFQTTVDLLRVEDKMSVFSLIAHSLAKISVEASGGLVALKDNKEAEIIYVFNSRGVELGEKYPIDLVAQAMDSNQQLIISNDKESVVCIPLQTKHRQYGAFWLEFPPSHSIMSQYSSILALASIATQAIERQVLLAEVSPR